MIKISYGFEPHKMVGKYLFISNVLKLNRVDYQSINWSKNFIEFWSGECR